ncbi:MAG: DUF2251 domain-containing protein [bacterium]|nr:DUF2251 domain-containing protein [bacterium]
MISRSFVPGTPTTFSSHSTVAPFIAAFEDDGDIGLLYAFVQLPSGEPEVEEVLVVYRLHEVQKNQVKLSIVWSDTGEQMGLIIDGHLETVIDFGAKVSYTQYGGSPHHKAWRRYHLVWRQEWVDMFPEYAAQFTAHPDDAAGVLPIESLKGGRYPVVAKPFPIEKSDAGLQALIGIFQNEPLVEKAFLYRVAREEQTDIIHVLLHQKNERKEVGIYMAIERLKPHYPNLSNLHLKTALNEADLFARLGPHVHAFYQQQVDKKEAKPVKPNAPSHL